MSDDKLTDETVQVQMYWHKDGIVRGTINYLKEKRNNG